MTRDRLIATLKGADGAILYWQLLDEDAVAAAVRDGVAYLADDDCLVLKEAIKIADGCYTLRGNPP